MLPPILRQVISTGNRMRIILLLFIFLVAMLALFLAWVFWPSNPAVFGKENVPLASLDEKVNRLADSIYTFQLEGSEEELAATLMEFRSDSAASRAMLYVHGFGDYFFHPHLAEWFLERNIDFYALDLRRYGRSLRPGSPPCFTDSVAAYYEEIQQALTQMEGSGYNRIGLLGHSTGGLISSLYAAEGPGRDKLDALILNSPFFQFNSPAWMVPVGSWIGSINPKKILRGPGNPAYSYSIHADYFGEWDYNKHWKPLEGFPVFAGWIHAMHEAQEKIRKGVELDMPVLVMHSDSSYFFEEGPDYVPSMQRKDAVLNVKHIHKRATRLGSRVDIRTIEGAMHDVFLSAPQVREEAFREMEDWLEKNF